jgi:hypothetical protein
MRSLAALTATASSSRVLNLSRVSVGDRLDDLNRDHPFFLDQNLNRAIFVKHRLRADEVYLLPKSPPVATKIIFPFDSTVLKSGGRSIFVGQMGFKEAMTAFLGHATPATQRDLQVLDMLAALPSLDPFLVREHLARHSFFPADCYFDISSADMKRMRAFVSDQIGQLISRAFGTAQGGATSDDVTRMVDAMMALNASDRLDPLRQTLGLEGHAFNEGIFGWKGFLYYKWQFGEIAKKLNRVISELDLVRFDDTPSSDMLKTFEAQRKKLRKSIRTAARECSVVLALYDDAFVDLVERGKAAAFRKFLLEAPRLFIELGSCIGTISHMVSYWSYRFPESEPLSMNSVEFGLVLSEFQQSLKPESTTEQAWTIG